MPKGPLKRDFLDICLITFSESVISEIQNLWGSSFFSKYSKFKLNFKNVEKNCEKIFCFWDNCFWIGIVKLSLLRRGYFSLRVQDTFHRQPMRYKAVPRFGMSIRETFFNSFDFAVINEYDKSAVMQIWTMLRHVYHVACRRVLWNGTF